MSTVERLGVDETIRSHRIAHKLYASFWDKGQKALDNVTEEVQVAILDGPNLSTAGFIKLEAIFNRDLSTFSALNLVCPYFMVRDEYIELDNYLDDPLNKMRDIVLVGQPGIGKSIYLTYCLLKRLTMGLTTIFTSSSDRRYLFRESGVYWIPEHSVNSSVYAEFEDGEDTLTLLDLNHQQREPGDVDVFRTLVATSPNLDLYRWWYKDRKAQHFYMKTWSWEEVYHARQFATEKMTEAELRDKFLKYGGSVRKLYEQSAEEIDLLVCHGIAACNDIDQLFPIDDHHRNDASHALVQINPEAMADGNLDRRFFNSWVTTPYIFHQLLERKQHQLATSMKNTFNYLCGQPGFWTAAGRLFEAVGHPYIRRLLSASVLTIQPLSATDAADVVFVDLRHVSGINHFNEAEIGRFDKVLSTCYHMPLSQTLAGINSFVIECDGQGVPIGVVAFQFTIADSHPISPDFLQRLFVPNTLGRNVYKWKLVFVVPMTGPQFRAQPWRPASEQNTWQGRVDQFVLRVDVDQLWDASR